MNSLPAYTVTEELLSSANCTLQRVQLADTGGLLLLKKYFHLNAGQIKLQKLSVGLLQEMKWDTVLYPQQLLEWNEGAVVVYNNAAGECLRTFIARKKKLSVKAFLPVAMALTGMVQQFQATRWIIKNLHPENILLDEPSKTCKIIDARKATNTNKNETALLLSEERESLPYISPEQTGLLNHITDYRSDLYSLGIILYELLTGEPPFNNREPLALLHAHVAVQPVSPVASNPYVPEALSSIVMKLLAKNPEDRYQSITGLLYDLQQSSSYDAGQPFTAGTRDTAATITKTDKLIGRRQELEVLQNTFATAAKGNRQVLYIHGNSGIGKTRLVKELLQYKPVAGQWMVAAKFDILQTNTPYSALIDAMKELVGKVVREEENELTYWKKRLLQFLNNNGQIIINALPQLKAVIGEQPEVQRLPPEESQNRFQQTCISFIEAFATDRHFLCIFLDDLQWADIASIKLLEQILLNERVKNLLFIGAYRFNEVPFTHPLSISQRKLEQWIYIKEIDLQPLQQADTAELVGHSLQNRVVQLQDLATLIYQKTGGNAFYILQLLTALLEAKDLYLNSNGYWEWNKKALPLAGIHQDVAGLLSEKLSSQSALLRQIFKCAACLGDLFDVKTVAHLTGQKINVVAKELATATNIGYVTSLDDNFEDYLKTSIDTPDEMLQMLDKSRFRFVHDQIKQAALRLVEQREQAQLNLQAGRYKVATLNKEDLAANIFYVADNFNMGATLLDNRKEMEQVVQLNLQAGIKAKSASAYEAAITYFEAGKRYLNFVEHYAVLFTFYLESTPCKMLIGKYAEAEADLDVLIEKAANRFDKLNALIQKAYLYITQDIKPKAVETTRAGYQLYGLRMPQKKWAIMSYLMVDIMKAGLLLTDKKIERLLDLPLMKDKERERFLEFILAVAPVLNQYNQNLFAWNTMKMVLYSLRYGNNGVASIAYIGYGMIVAQLFKQYKKGMRLAEIAIALNNRPEFAAIKWKVLLSYYNFVHHWTKPVRPELDVIMEVANGAYANGDPVFAGYAVFIYHQKKFALGFGLPELQHSYEEYLTIADRRQHIEGVHFLKGYLQAVRCLRGQEQDVLLLGKDFNAPEQLQTYIVNCSYSVAADTFIPFIGTLYIFQYFEEAYRQYYQCINYVSFVQARYEFAEYNLYGALICAKAAALKTAPAAGLIKQVQKHVAVLKTWQQNCPENFEPQYLLAAAALEGMKGKMANALVLYEQAIAAADKHLFINYKAMACELAGISALQTGNRLMSKTYLENARQCYWQWGAVAKVQQMEKEYAELGASILSRKETKESSAESADMLLLLQAAQTIAKEKDTDSLVEQFMNTIIQYAGADTGYLLIYAHSGFMVKAEYHPATGVQLVTTYPDGSLIPLTVLKGVAQSKEALIINNPSQDTGYSDLTYFKSKHPRSVLCYPILRQGVLFGLLYLENYAAGGIFSFEKINMLHMVSLQMAVLLDNANLSENMEALVKERVSEMETKMDVSEALLRNVLPKEAILELKATGKTTAQRFDDISVLLADIKGFTLISEILTPEELIAKIDLYFRAFDDIMARYGLEKIKTIGDAYMAIGGLGTDAAKGAKAIVNAAIAMQQFMSEQGTGDSPDRQLLLRVGIHTGTVIAGVVGYQKLQYDIWGDTVNTAARMEQNCEPGKINISKATCTMVQDAFRCTYRGRIDAKNKGELDMYFVESTDPVPYRNG